MIRSSKRPQSNLLSSCSLAPGSRYTRGHLSMWITPVKKNHTHSGLWKQPFPFFSALSGHSNSLLWVRSVADQPGSVDPDALTHQRSKCSITHTQDAYYLLHMIKIHTRIKLLPTVHKVKEVLISHRMTNSVSKMAKSRPKNHEALHHSLQGTSGIRKDRLKVHTSKV